ncbi:MAG: anti-sigma factor antagonist, partial [Proteobacteria bacterium]|nr:anti-sigma factor antagonist [Pseudomonadota bacterium]
MTAKGAYCMEIVKERVGDRMTFRISGKLDTMTAPELDKALGGELDGATELVMDLAGLEYISSFGLRLFMRVKKSMARNGGTMQIIHPQERVMEVFEMTGLADLFEIHKDDVPVYYPVRPIQRWMFDTQLSHARSTMLNIGGLFRLDNRFDLDKLMTAVRDVLKAYDVFGTRFLFHPKTKELCQTFTSEREPITIEELSDADIEIERHRLRQPYQLINKPMYRIRFFRTPSANYFFMEFHHVMMDGMSATILFTRELELAYQGRPVRPRKGSSYRELVEEESAVTPTNLEEGHRYWEKMMRAFDPARHILPNTGDALSALGTFDMKVTEDLTRSFLRASGFEEEPFLMAAALLAMAARTGQRDAFMGWVHNGRDTMRKMRIMGLMLDQYPIYQDFSESIAISSLVAGIAERQKEALTYKAAMDLVYERGLEDDLICFMFQRNIDGDINIAGLPITLV